MHIQCNAYYAFYIIAYIEMPINWAATTTTEKKQFFVLFLFIKSIKNNFTSIYAKIERFKCIQISLLNWEYVSAS